MPGRAIPMPGRPGGTKGEEPTRPREGRVLPKPTEMARSRQPWAMCLPEMTRFQADHLQPPVPCHQLLDSTLGLGPSSCEPYTPNSSSHKGMMFSPQVSGCDRGTLFTSNKFGTPFETTGISCVFPSFEGERTLAAGPWSTPKHQEFQTTKTTP